ncbi:MAG: hypothetical protein ACF8R7_16565 [Phycisphaerales bacterium JB039]
MICTRTVAACAGVALALAGAAQAQWSDNFDSYATGSLLTGGWDGWDGSAAAAGIVTTDQALSGPNSLEISGGADAVHPFSGYTSGQWTLSAWNYIATGDLTADTYFIVNNQYNPGGPYTWAVEMQFDVDTATVMDDFRAHTPIPVVFDQWVELRFEIDLDADTIDSYYNGTLLSSGQYTRAAGDPLEIANIDLFTTGARSYYDDISLIPAPGASLLLAMGLGAMTRRRR